MESLCIYTYKTSHRFASRIDRPHTSAYASRTACAKRPCNVQPSSPMLDQDPGLLCKIPLRPGPSVACLLR